MKLSETKYGLLLCGAGKSFSLPETLDCGQAFRWLPCEDGGWHGIAGGHYLKLSRQGDDILLHGTTMEQYQDFWKRYFDFSRSYPALKRRFSRDPILKEAISYAPGIRILRQEPWETLCTFIISSNNNIPRIRGIVQRLCEAFGDPVPGSPFRTFPAPERIVPLSEEDLAFLRSGYRARFILDAARKTASGQVNLRRLYRLPTESAREKLMEINGVGPKVADCVLLFAYSRTECVPMDTWIKKVMAVLYPDGFPDFLLPEAGLAQQYLFHYARHHAQKFREL